MKRHRRRQSEGVGLTTATICSGYAVSEGFSSSDPRGQGLKLMREITARGVFDE